MLATAADIKYLRSLEKDVEHLEKGEGRVGTKCFKNFVKEPIRKVAVIGIDLCRNSV